MIRFFRDLKIRYKFALLLNVFAVSIIIIVAFGITQQFKASLKERIFLQLTSIRTLKTRQVERLLENQIQEIETLIYNLDNEAYLDALSDDQFIHVDSIVVGEVRADSIPYSKGAIKIKDISTQIDDGGVHLAYYVRDSKVTLIFYLTATKLKDILFQRTGMGNTGETYIVGSDNVMRTQSRFYPDSIPTKIWADTKAVQIARRNGEGAIHCMDYRGEAVFSAFAPFQYKGLEWVILSEIDEKEAMQPLRKMEKRIYLFTFIIMVIVVVLSNFLSLFIVRPIIKVKRTLTRISIGENSDKLHVKNRDEIGDLFITINSFIEVVDKIIVFANEIANGNFGEDMPIRGKNDGLVKALNHMKNRLVELTESERTLLLKNQRQLMAGEEQERARLSRELHDSIGPLLTNLKLSVHNPSNLNDEEHLNTQILHIIDEVRKISFNLMPSVLRDFGIVAAIKNYLDLQFKNLDIEVTFSHSKEGEPNLSMEVSLNIYRIVQEAIHNIIKHAKATEVKLSVTEFDKQVNVFIADNGVGFDPEKVIKGNGLDNMEERVKMFGGHWEFESGPGGSTIEVEFTS